MLVLNVKTGVNFHLPNGEMIRVVNADQRKRSQVKLAIDAPLSVLVLRDGAKKRGGKQDGRKTDAA